MRNLAMAMLLLLSTLPLLCQDQEPAPSNTQKLLCNETTTVCTHKLVNDFTYKTLSTSKAVVTVSIAANGKYTRLDVGITNSGQLQFDVLPTEFAIAVTAPMARVLHMVPPEKIVSSEKHHAGWANAINAMGAGMASQQATTQTNSSGTVQASSSDGAYANGSYNGTSTSTTSVPDYAAQARARENIQRRRAALAAHAAELEQTALRANTVEAGKAVSGFVFFESEKHGEKYVVDLPIDDVVYEFSFDRPKR